MTKLKFIADAIAKLRADGWLFSPSAFEEDSPGLLGLQAAYDLHRAALATPAAPGPAALATTGEAAAGWVAVSERLPEDEDAMFYGPYWLAYKDGEVTGGHFRSQNKFNDFTWNGDKHEDDQATHYMVQFLPAAPVTPTGTQADHA